MTAISFLNNRGYSTAINAPFTGTLVPMRFYQKDKRVSSIMIEINRGLYMNEDGSRKDRFSGVHADVQALLNAFSKVLG